MKYYVQFYTRSLDGSLIEACGDTSVFILDGRNNLETMINDANERVRVLSTWQKHKLYEIRKSLTGRFEPFKCVYRNFNIEKNLQENKQCQR